MARQPFTIAFAEEVIAHLRAIERKDHSLIRETIDEQLQFEPDRETRNRKPLKRRAFFEADWELRFGPKNCFRAFYNIDFESLVSRIRAIGIKEGDRLFIGGEEEKP
jgi:hypothetical protein